MNDTQFKDEAWKMPVAVLLAIFLLNDIAFYLAPTATTWLLVDYVSKIMALAVVFATPVLRQSVTGFFGPLRLTEVTLGIALALAALVIMEETLMPVLRETLPTGRLIKFPQIESPPLYWVDMTFGLALTAVSEELVFRGVLRKALAGIIPGTLAMIIVSSLAFGAVHWGHGLPNVIYAALAGAILMGLYLRTGSLLPGMVVHYAIDVWYFA